MPSRRVARCGNNTRSCIYHLAFLQASNDTGRTMPNAEVRHSDERTVCGLEDKPHVERRAAVLTHRLPVVAAFKHLAGQPLAVERAAGHHSDAAIDAGRSAQEICSGRRSRRITNNGRVRIPLSGSGGSSRRRVTMGLIRSMSSELLRNRANRVRIGMSVSKSRGH